MVSLHFTSIFEVMSAFGTCGLSLGVTSDISDISKVVLMVLMFIGRVGLISFIIMIAGRREPDKFHYPKAYSNRIYNSNLSLVNVDFNWNLDCFLVCF